MRSFQNLIVCTAVLATACTPAELAEVSAEAVAQSEHAVVNGRLATGAESMGTVSLAGNLSSFCTGTLIAPRVVVTAAHCLEGETAGSMSIVAGALNVGAANANQVYAVASLITHNNYQPYAQGDNEGVGTTNDIALVITTQDVTTATVVQIPSAQSVDQNMDNGSEVTVTGFGVTSPQSATGTLYIGEVSYNYRTGGEFVAGLGEATDSCYGDSGGPVYVEDDGGDTYVIGVVSRGANSASANCGGGGIYGFLPNYADWIEDNAAGLFDAGSLGAIGAVADLDGGGGGPAPTPGQCAGACGGQSPDGCWCDETCASQGDCCADYVDTCTGGGEPTNPVDNTWTCDPSWEGDGECDCGCGAMDSDCAANDIELCVYNNCAGGEDVSPVDIRLCGDVVVEPSPAPGEPEASPGEPEASPGEPEASPGEPEASPGEPEASPGEPEAAPTEPEPEAGDVDAPAGWSCADKQYEDGVCDCGCGIRDVDCSVNNIGACERENCGENGSVDPDDIAVCLETSPEPTPAPNDNDDEFDVVDIEIEGDSGGDPGADLPAVAGGCSAAGSRDPGSKIPGVFGALGLLIFASRRRRR